MISVIQVVVFDFIFADTWHGKYRRLEEALQRLKPGGLYVIDHMLPQPNWPNGHGARLNPLAPWIQHVRLDRCPQRTPSRSRSPRPSTSPSSG